MENSFLGFRYAPPDSKATSAVSGPIDQPKLFSLTSKINQLENRINGDKPNAFRPTRGNGPSKSSPLFPGLRRYQANHPSDSTLTSHSDRTNNANVNAYDNQNRQNSPQKPLFSLFDAISNIPTSRPKVFPSTSMKLEQFSSPPIPETPHISSSTTHYDHELGLQFDGGPHQMLPPPPPPQAPDSRPASPAPRPRPQSRSRSRSNSHRGDESDEERGVRMNASDAGGDMSTIAITALNQVRSITAELMEERRRAKALLTQFNTLTTSHESLNFQHSTTSEELRVAREQLKSTKNSSRDEAQALRTERDEAVQKRLVEKNRVDLLKKNIEDLKESYTSLKTEFLLVKDAWDIERKAAEDVRGARVWAEDALTKVENLLHDDDSMARGARETVTALQLELTDSRHVIDILREKLTNLSSSLAEALNRIHEIEATEREVREQFKSMIEDIKVDAEERISTEKVRLAQVEMMLRKKTNELEEANATLEEADQKIHEQNNKLSFVQTTTTEAEKRLAEMEAKRLFEIEESERKEKRLSEAEKIAENAEKIRREAELNMATLQERFNTQALTLRLEKERFADLQERLQASEEALSKTQRMLNEARKATDEARKTIDEKSAENGRLTQTMLAKTDEGRNTIDEKSAEIGRLTQSLLAKADELKESQNRLSEQALRRSEEIGELRASFTKVKDKAAADLTSLELAQERCAKIDELLREKTDRLYKADTTIATLEQKISVQLAELRHSQVRYNDLENTMRTLKDQLTISQNALNEAQRQASERDRQPSKLEKLYELLEHDRAKAQKEGAKKEKEEEQRMMGEDARIKELTLEVNRLEAENKAFREKAGSLRDKYGRNELSDDEKDFAEWLMKLARSLHEEEDVAKSNELRRKENFVSQLQTKIRELESSLAHLIKEKEEQSSDRGLKSMIDLNAFMLSSPIIHPEGLPCDNLPTSAVNSVPSTVQGQPPIPATSASVAKAANPTGALATPVVAVQDPEPMKSKPNAGLSFSSLALSDSEDDIPLSEVSALAKSVLGKRDRVSSPAQPALNPTRYGSRRAKAAAAPAKKRTTQTAEAAAVIGEKKATTTEGGAKPRKKRK
ncbi:hypothetical protein H0H92_006803 [Tricholoma furcatifolium]|nr:hypothetical protein H0H92_006803 [Tricholoma furcatifolium]